MIELEEALRRILAVVPPASREQISLSECLGRVILQPVVAPADLPPFDNSAMDGYALRAADVTTASPEHPVRLRLTGRVAAGQVHSGQVLAGQCVRLFTGSPLPADTDAVVMQEDCRTDSNVPGGVLVLDAVKPFENIRLQGGDVKAGSAVAGAGEAMSPATMALFSALGLTEMFVSKRPTIGVLATGTELVEPGGPLGPGQIYESNRTMLASLIRQAGAVSHPYPIVADSRDALRDALERALSLHDAVVTCGGASVGELDLVKSVLQELGGELQFWQVAMRPGKPFFLGRLQGKPVFGLPGNPVSAFVTFLLLVRPALRQWLGAREIGLPAHPGVLVESLANPGNRRHFARVQVDSQGAVRPAGMQASHALGSLSAANGLIDVPPRSELRAGEKVKVMRFD